MSSRRSRRGGKRHGHHIQAVEKILAETTLGDLGPQLPIGRRDDPDIDLNLAGAADPSKNPFLNGA